VFTANMTGNAVLLGLAIGQAQELRVVRSVVALLGFVAGVGLGARLVDPGQERVVWSSRITRALGVEAALLTVFGVGWWAVGPRPAGTELAGLIALSAMAMGVQSAAARRCAVSGVATTYITGTLTGLMAELAALSTPPLDWGRSAAVLAALVAGAAAGALAQARFPLAAAILPAALLGTVVAVAAASFRSGADAASAPGAP
jgi:uncharacterized membrane protein YoaK (UPF0700 family)